ncbi:alpha/beta hydrolase [Nocardia sp. CA-128927]|uniref:alpha/beta hydrolase n=1 Tax=Nocardia sp. CA-128927 TaxID=3239975 RepID=UPI003D983708
MPAHSTDDRRYYRDQDSWRELQEFLPLGYRLREDRVPSEEFWQWRGNAIHLDRYARPESPVKVVLHHGVGTNGRQLSLILGAPLAELGFETVAIDNLGYGMTTVAARQQPSYTDWVDMVADFVAAESARDPRPIVLYGLSASGMLAYHVAAKGSAVAGVVGMCFLDERIGEVRAKTAASRASARMIPLTLALARTPLARLQVPMRTASKMSALTNNPAALAVMLADQSSAGNAVTLRFLASYLTYTPAVEPEDFDTCPILLTQPTADRWSPLHLSTLFLDRVTRVDKTVVSLDGAGHYPLEEPGLRQLLDAVADFAEAVSQP